MYLGDIEHFSHPIYFQENGKLMRRAHSEELLSEVGIDDTENSEATTTTQSVDNKKLYNADSAAAAMHANNSGLLQVSDHPRMRHNSADNVEEADDDNNNYENFAHELSNSYLWSQSSLMTNTRDLSCGSNGVDKRHNVQVDLNSTNSDSISHRSSSEIVPTPTPACGLSSLSVNSRPASSSVSPERRLDMVLGSESIQFSDQNPSFKQMARPIPTFNSFGITHADEVHRARPAYAPTPSPGGSDDTAPPLPARQVQQQLQQTSQQQTHSLPFFPYHQFPGRSVKPMRKNLYT